MIQNWFSIEDSWLWTVLLIVCQIDGKKSNVILLISHLIFRYFVFLVFLSNCTASKIFNELNDLNFDIWLLGLMPVKFSHCLFTYESCWLISCALEWLMIRCGWLKMCCFWQDINQIWLCCIGYNLNKTIREMEIHINRVGADLNSLFNIIFCKSLILCAYKYIACL